LTKKQKTINKKPLDLNELSNRWVVIRNVSGNATVKDILLFFRDVKVKSPNGIYFVPRTETCNKLQNFDVYVEFESQIGYDIALGYAGESCRLKSDANQNFELITLNVDNVSNAIIFPACFKFI
jgi:hypothetical protein